MCLCYQSPVHVYNADRSVLQNISENLSLRLDYFLDDIYRVFWSASKVINVGAGAAPQSRFGFTDCSCSPDFIGSMFGIIPTGAGTWIALLAIAALLGIPIVIGIVGDVRSRLSTYAIIVWLAIQAAGFIEGYMELSRFRDAGGMQSYWAHLPIQLAFNLLLMIVIPAATIRLVRSYFCSAIRS